MFFSYSAAGSVPILTSIQDNNKVTSQRAFPLWRQHWTKRCILWHSAAGTTKPRQETSLLLVGKEEEWESTIVSGVNRNNLHSSHISCQWQANNVICNQAWYHLPIKYEIDRRIERKRKVLKVFCCLFLVYIQFCLFCLLLCTKGVCSWLK